jgi:hypothetical protein
MKQDPERAITVMEPGVLIVTISIRGPLFEALHEEVGYHMTKRWTYGVIAVC